MKIHSPHQSVSGQMPNGRQAFRLLAFCGVVALCVTTCTSASAQSRLFGGLTDSLATQVESRGAVRSGLFTHGDESYQVVNTAGYRTAADIGQSELGTVAPVGFNSCGLRGNSCDSACGSSCGGSCGGSCGNSYGGYGAYGDPCAPCNPYCYVSFEALYMDLENSNRYSASPDFFMNSFDYEVAPRLTIGSVPDCVHGYEVSFTGRFEWDRGAAIRDDDGNIRTRLRPIFPVTAPNLSAFNNATRQIQRMKAQYWSVEGNSTLVGWEVAKLLAGVRFIDFRHRFSYLSQNIDNEFGQLESGVKNRLLGAQIGMDLLYPIATNAYTDFRTRGGLYANFADLGIFVINNGETVAALFDDKTRLAGMFEIGGGFRYQLGEMLSLRAGGELWYLSRIGRSHNQIRNAVGQFRHRTNDDILMVGVSFGAEFKY